MKAYHFTEFPYPYVPENYEETYGSMRVTLPSSVYDPKIGRDLYMRYIEEYIYADELGLDLMLNEHHQTATCINSATNLIATYIASKTKNAKIVLLGNQLAHQNPLKTAEELAILDHLSNGRLISGFVRGVGSEIHPANTNPTQTYERFYEAHDLIVKAWTSGEVFNWEGKHYQYRYVNLWPRTYQQPTPPIWTSGIFNQNHIRWAAEHQYTFGIVLADIELTNRAFNTYRETCMEKNISYSPDKLCYATMMYTAETDEQAEREGKQLLWYLEDKVPPGFYTPPGYNSPDSMVILSKLAGLGERGKHNWDELRRNGTIMVGNPKSVVKQIKEHYEKVGGYGHLIMMNQAGFMTHEQVKKSIKLFAQEVYPEIQDLGVSISTQ